MPSPGSGKPQRARQGPRALNEAKDLLRALSQPKKSKNKNPSKGHSFISQIPCRQGNPAKTPILCTSRPAEPEPHMPEGFPSSRLRGCLRVRQSCCPGQGLSCPLTAPGSPVVSLPSTVQRDAWHQGPRPCHPSPFISAGNESNMKLLHNPNGAGKSHLWSLRNASLGKQNL